MSLYVLTHISTYAHLNTHPHIGIYTYEPKHPQHIDTHAYTHYTHTHMHMHVECSS